MESALSSIITDLKHTRKVAVCGMGTCSIAGEIISDYMDGMKGSPITVVKGVDLPKWVDSNTTVIVLSYSGNTKETINLYRAAVRKKAQVVCITSGGLLNDLCERDGNTLVRMVPGYHSRGALGFMIGYIAVVLVAIGLLDSLEDFNNAIPAVKEHRDTFADNEDNEAHHMSHIIDKKVPVIYTYFNMRSVGIRWKSQINENAKMMSFSGTIPEFNHNELVGWTEDNTDSFIPVVILDEDASPMLKCMADAPISMMIDKGSVIYKYHIKGKNILEKSLKAMVTGDFLSLYLAESRHENPLNSDAVDKIKEIIESKDQSDESES